MDGWDAQKRLRDLAVATILYSMPAVLLSTAFLVISSSDVDWTDWLSFGLFMLGALNTGFAVWKSLSIFISLRNQECTIKR